MALLRKEKGVHKIEDMPEIGPEWQGKQNTQQPSLWNLKAVFGSLVCRVTYGTRRKKRDKRSLSFPFTR